MTAVPAVEHFAWKDFPKCAPVLQNFPEVLADEVEDLRWHR